MHLYGLRNIEWPLGGFFDLFLRANAVYSSPLERDCGAQKPTHNAVILAHIERLSLVLSG